MRIHPFAENHVKAPYPKYTWQWWKEGWVWPWSPTWQLKCLALQDYQFLETAVQVGWGYVEEHTFGYPSLEKEGEMLDRVLCSYSSSQLTISKFANHPFEISCVKCFGIKVVLLTICYCFRGKVILLKVYDDTRHIWVTKDDMNMSATLPSNRTTLLHTRGSASVSFGK